MKKGFSSLQSTAIYWPYRCGLPTRNFQITDVLCISTLYVLVTSTIWIYNFTPLSSIIRFFQGKCAGNEHFMKNYLQAVWDWPFRWLLLPGFSSGLRTDSGGRGCVHQSNQSGSVLTPPWFFVASLREAETTTTTTGITTTTTTTRRFISWPNQIPVWGHQQPSTGLAVSPSPTKWYTKNAGRDFMLSQGFIPERTLFSNKSAWSVRKYIFK